MSVGPLERMTDVLDALLAADLDVLSDDELDAELITLVRASHRLHAAIGRRAARWDSRGVWCTDGSRSAAGRLSRDTGLSPSSASQVLRRARSLRQMPATTDAHASGALSPDHVDLLAHAASHERGVVFARDEEVLVESCQALRYPEAVKAVSYWRRHADALVDAPEPLVEPVLHIGAGASGEVRLTGHLDPLGGAIVTAALERIAGELTSDGAPRPKGRLQHDALVEMAQRAMAAPPGARRPAPLVTVLVGDESLRHVCELDTGTVVHPRHVAPYVADAIVQTFIFDGPRSPLAATPQRTFTGALRRAIQARDRHCQHPSGCDEPIRRCDVDHIVPHSRGGPTAPANGRLLCTFHNRILPAHTSPQVTGPRPDD